MRETAFGNDKIQAGIIFFWRNKITGSYKKGEKMKFKDLPLYNRIMISIMSFLMVCMIAILPFQFTRVDGTCMEPVIHDGSVIVGCLLPRNYKVGDIVIFKKDDQLMVKRIAFTGGETVTRYGETLTVPDGCFYMLGDNFPVSYDSRYWEEPFVPAKDILAKVILPAENTTEELNEQS